MAVVVLSRAPQFANVIRVENGAAPLSLIWSNPSRDASATLEHYRAFSATLAQLKAETAFEEVVAIVDRVQPEALSAVDVGGWDCLVAMLILSFPDIRWLFAATDNASASWQPIGTATALTPEAPGTERTDLFDGSGLRNWTRERTNQALANAGDVLRLPLRSQKAAVIEDEKAFAELHACTAYLHGYRTDLVTSWRHMQELFCGSDGAGHGYYLLIEDLNLQFADRELSRDLGDLERRGEICPKLDSRNPVAENSAYRLIVTTAGAEQAAPGAQTLDDYANTKASGFAAVVRKPIKGMAHLWKKPGQVQAISRWWPELSAQKGRGWAPGYSLYEEAAPSDGQPRAHGAPGKLTLIAEHLLHRARLCVFENASLAELLRGAVLAREALELSGYKAPALSLEALELQHLCELTAECQFSGLEFRISTRSRLRDIADAVRHACIWFEPGSQRRAALNGEMKILAVLVPVLREHGQFEEEQLCLHRVRQLHAQLWAGDGPKQLALPVLTYTSLMLRSVPLFGIVILLWLALLTALFYMASVDTTVPCAIGDAVTAILGAGPPSTCRTNPHLPQGLIVLAVMVGIFHIGIFISHVYASLSRR